MSVRAAFRRRHISSSSLLSAGWIGCSCHPAFKFFDQTTMLHSMSSSVHRQASACSAALWLGRREQGECLDPQSAAVGADRFGHATRRCRERCLECAQLYRQLADECCRARNTCAARSCRLCAGVCDDIARALSRRAPWPLDDTGPMLDSAVTISTECAEMCVQLGDDCILGARCGDACRRLPVACLGLISASAESEFLAPWFERNDKAR